MITPNNWLFFCDGLQFQSYEEWNGSWVFPHPLDRDWNESLKNLSQPTDKKIIVYDGIESGGYWPLMGSEADPLLYLIHTYSHPDNKIWYTNTDAYAQRNYDEWCELVKPKMRIKMRPLVPGQTRDAFVESLESFNNLPKIESKHRVICMVNHPTFARILTLRELAGLPGFIHSFNCTSLEYVTDDGESNDDNFNDQLNMLDEGPWRYSEDGNDIEFLDNHCPVDTNCGINMSNERFDQTKRIFFKTQFHLDHLTPNAFYDFLPVQEWLDADIDLVCETQQVRQWHFSEKTCKPLGFAKPFLVIGCEGWYEAFEQAGFVLYDELFDYSFDKIESFRRRHQAIISQIKDILNMDRDVLNKKILDIQGKIQYNKRQLLECRDVKMNIFEMAKQIDLEIQYG